MSNITYKWIFPSDTFYFVTDSISIAISLTSLIIFVALCFILFRYSPVEMKVYKWYLLSNHALFFILEWGASMHPKLVLPNPAMAFDSSLLSWYKSANFANFPYETLVSVGTLFAGIVIIAYAYTLMLLFIFRYAQTLNKLTLKRYLTSAKIILFHISAVAGASLGSFLIVNHYVVFDDELKEQYRTLYPEIYKRIENLTLHGAKVTF